MMFQTFYFVECFHFCIEGRDPMEFWVVSMHECIDREKTYRNKSSFREKEFISGEICCSKCLLFAI